MVRGRWISEVRGLRLAIFQLIHEGAQLIPFLGAQVLDAQQMGEKRRQGTAAEFLGHRPQLPADQLVAVDRRFEHVRPGPAVADDAALALEPFQQLLHGGVLRGGPFGVKNVGKLADGRRPPIPQHLEDRKFGVGYVLR